MHLRLFHAEHQVFPHSRTLIVQPFLVHVDRTRAVRHLDNQFRWAEDVMILCLARTAAIFRKNAQRQVRLRLALVAQDGSRIIQGLHAGRRAGVTLQKNAELEMPPAMRTAERGGHVNDSPDQLKFCVLGIGRVAPVKLRLRHPVAGIERRHFGF